MKGLTPEARALLADYRRGEGLEPTARQRVARALDRRLASGAPGLELDAPPPQLPLDTIAPRTLSAGAKIAGVVLGIGLASFAALRASREAPALPPPAVSAPLRSGAPARSAPEQPPPQRVVIVEPAAQRVAPETNPDAEAPRRKRALELGPEPRPQHAAATPRAEAAERPALDPAAQPAQDAGARSPLAAAASEPEPAHPIGEPPRQAAQDEAVMIDDEVALLRSAHAALRSADPKRALVHLAEHRWRFPQGQLADSREVARMLALCASGEAALARAEAQRFIAAQPRSPFTERVRGICVEPER